MFQFNIVFGILIAFLSNALLANVGQHAWRWMLGVEAVPALIYSLLCLGLPESPRWLITNGNDREAGIAVFKRVMPTASESELSTVANEIVASAGQAEHAEGGFSNRLRKPITLAFLIAFFNQLSGINAVL